MAIISRILAQTRVYFVPTQQHLVQKLGKLLWGPERTTDHSIKIEHTISKMEPLSPLETPSLAIEKTEGTKRAVGEKSQWRNGDVLILNIDLTSKEAQDNLKNLKLWKKTGSLVSENTKVFWSNLKKHK
jgi:hypothetical protein